MPNDKLSPSGYYKKVGTLSYSLIEVVIPERFLAKLPKGIETIKERLNSWDYVNKYFLGRHWLDKTTKTDNEDNVGIIVDEPSHWHIYILFNAVCQFKTVLNKLHGFKITADSYDFVDDDNINDTAQFIDLRNIQRIKGRFSSCYTYLYHQDDKSKSNDLKHKYTHQEMKPYFYCHGIEETEIEDEDSSNWNNLIGLTKTIIKGIEQGDITLYRFVTDNDLVPHYDYQRIKQEVMPVFERLSLQKLLKYDTEGSTMKVYYLYGKTGSGKTDFAKSIANSLGLEYYITSSGKNPFDDYLGQRCVIFDDWDSTVLSYKDMLKLLDPHNRSMTRARYKNIAVMPDVLIITTDKDIKDSFALEGNINDISLRQFIRRIQYVYHFTDEYIIPMFYDDYNTAPKSGQKYINPIFEKYNLKSTIHQEDNLASFGLVPADTKVIVPNELKCFM